MEVTPTGTWNLFMGEFSLSQLPLTSPFPSFPKIPLQFTLNSVTRVQCSYPLIFLP